MAEDNYQDFANFSFSDSDPTLPIKGSPDVSRKELHHGYYSSVFELDDNKVVKLIRIGKFDKKGKIKDSPHSNQHLAENESDLMNNLVELKKEKDDIEFVLRHYVGEFIPQNYGSVITESPRRSLEIKMNNISQQHLDKVPSSETSIMEVWENVNPKSMLNRKSYARLKAIENDEEFRQQRSRFATGLAKMCLKSKLMVDIADWKGVETRTPDNDREYIYKMDEMVKFDKDNKGSLIVTRNTAYNEGKLKFFDIYPIDALDPGIDDTFLDSVVSKLDEGKVKELAEEVESIRDNSEQKHLTRYLYLLHKMGADFSQI